MERRLAVILAADVAGYSALMERDETGTFKRLKDIRQQLFAPEIKRCHGRIFKTTGDGLFAEFTSVANAVQCAIELQKGLRRLNESTGSPDPIRVRIGINLGEVIVEGSDRYGDGVNVAARLEQLAEPGSVYVSGKVAKELQKTRAFDLQALGEHRLRNLKEPVDVYRIRQDSSASPLPVKRLKWRLPPLRHFPSWGLLALPLALLVAASLWSLPWTAGFRPDLPLPEKPSVAVLPFINMSADPEQSYFADGITDNLITDLSKIPGLFVISRNSAFAYKDKPVEARQVAKRLGVRYVLEGSVQRSAGLLRINAQLIDAVNDGHVWAERFDGDLAEVFILQDKVTRSVAEALAVRLAATSQDALVEKRTDNPAAYDSFLKGLEHMRRRTPQEFLKAIPFLEQAIVLDPQYGEAHAALAWVYVVSYQRRWFDVLKISDTEARARAKRYLDEAQKRPTALSHQVAGQMLAASSDYRGALAEFKEAIVLDPSNAQSYAALAEAFSLLGKAEEALPLIQRAMRIDPHYPPYFLNFLGLAQYKLRQYDEAAASFEQAVSHDPDDLASRLCLVATYGHLGRKQDALATLAEHDRRLVAKGGIPAAINTSSPHIRDGLRLAKVAYKLTESTFAVANKVEGNEARQIFLGHRLQGRTFRTGINHEATIASDGSAVLTGDWATYSIGTIRFEGDHVCLVWPGSSRSCGQVSRNPGGTRAMQNEFIWFLDQGEMTFSQID